MWKYTTTINNSRNTRISKKSTQVSFVLSQFILLQSRKKWGIIFALATITGIFCSTDNGGTFLTTLLDIKQAAATISVLKFISD
jgi:hypothetical protein